ncbi:MAG: amidohydrolase family protein [Rhodospirillaceae bacterium]|jgi:predicted TIM-barrel fold metal-dependent hydrolase|nr:amidohydrolase family protein [Rhodospirillaceae bacterium]
MTDVPKLATDCHTHLFGPADKFPYAENRTYTPQTASEDDANQMLAHLGLERIVVVHASIYGDNNRLVQGLKNLGNKARGVILLTGSETTQDLQELDAAGVRGVRLNNISSAALSSDGVADAFRDIANKIADLGWHVQVFLQGDDLKAALQHLGDMPVPMVIDHFGFLSADKPENAELRELLLDRLRAGLCWVKMSASYRLGGDGRDAARRLTELLVDANPERLVWGSDWPHTPVNRDPKLRKQEQPPREVDTKQLLTDFMEAVPTQDLRHRILVDNPANLYRF